MSELPQLDAAVTHQVQQARANPFADLLLASQNFWAGRTGREYPPAPTFRDVKGRKMLGRYMDPFGCQAHMRSQRGLWEKWYTNFFITIGCTVLFCEVDWLSIFLIGPLCALRYFYIKDKYRRQYDTYYAVQDEIIQTGEPKWVPYDKKRLALINQNPSACWP